MDIKLLFAEQIVENKFSKEDNNYGLLVLSCYGLLTKFEDYYDIIKEIFNTCEFYIENKSIIDLLKEKDIDSKSLFPEIAEIYYTHGLTVNGKHASIIDGKDFNPKNHQIFCSTMYGENDTLNTLVHELAHLVKSSINSSFIKLDESIILRNGINLTEYKSINQEKYVIDTFSSLDEVINTLQTTDMLQEIKKLNKNHMNPVVQKTFNQLDLETLDYISGYEIGATLLFLLWNNEHFKENIEENIVIGNIDNIVSDFDNIVGETNTFYNFSESFDIIDTSDDNEIISNRANYIITISQLYDIKSKKCKGYKKQ